MNSFNKSIQRMRRFYKKGGLYVYLAKLLYRYHRIIFSCDIAYKAEIDDVYFAHRGLACCIHPNAKIGKGTIVKHCTSIGELTEDHKAPVIGENCFIGVNATILGDIRIGNNVTIGACALVLKDLPDNCIAVGVPAKILRYKSE